MKPIGVFGGTFDPIHYGHLRTAFEMLQALRFDEVRFMPCGDPPHRGVTFAGTASKRSRWCRRRSRASDGFVVDDRELQRDGPSYTVDTLAELREEFPERSLGLIVGMDAFLGICRNGIAGTSFSTSRTYRGASAGLARAGHRRAGRAAREPRHASHRGPARGDGGHIHIHAVTQLEISSTEIRESSGRARSRAS